MVAELARPLEGGFSDAGREAAKASGTLEEGGGFQRDHLRVLLETDVDALLELEIEDLTTAEGKHRFREQRERRPEAVDVPWGQQVND
jgi:hypothetical protein